MTNAKDQEISRCASEKVDAKNAARDAKKKHLARIKTLGKRNGK